MTELLVERDQEIALLRGAVQELAAGRPAFIEVTGPPGYGRTALLNRAVALGVEAGVRVLHAVGCRTVGGDAPVLAQLVTALGLDVAQYLTAPVVTACEAFLDEARTRPLLLVVDDAQWLDEQSRDWLRALLRRLAGAPVLVVLATNNLGTVTESMLLDLATEAALTAPVWHILRLRPLSPEAVAALAAVVCPGQDDDILATVARCTHGVPVLVRAVLTAFEGIGGIISPACRDVLVEESAEARNDWVARVVRALPPQAAAVARALAVCGTDFDWLQVCLLAGLQPASAGRGCAVLRQIGLMAPDSPRRLSDAATDEQVLAEMTAVQRAELHGRAFALGIRIGVAPERLARILFATPVGEPGAVWTLRSEAKRLLAKDEPEAAARLLKRALQEPVAASDRADLAVELAETEAAYAPEASDRRLLDLLLGGDPVGPAARIRAVDMLVSRERVAVARRTIVAAVALPDTDDDQRAALTALYWMAEYSMPETARPDVADLPPLPADPADPASAGVTAWRTALQGRDRARARSLARAALDAPMRHEDPLGPRIIAASTLVLTEDTVEARAGADAVIAEARRRGTRALAAWALLVRSSLALSLQHWDQAADDLAQMAQELPRRCWHPALHGYTCGVEVALNLQRGLPDEARRVAAAPLPIGGEYSIAWAQHLFARGLVLFADGDHETALEHFLESGRRMQAHQWHNPVLLSWRLMAGLAHLAVGSATAARALIEEELAAAEDWGAPAYLKMVRSMGEPVLGRQ